MCMSVLKAYMFVSCLYAWCPQKPEEGVELQKIASYHVSTGILTDLVEQKPTTEGTGKT